MLNDGYAAVTSRRVGAEAALKPQLVHYYFRTMDDLFLALYRRRAEQGFERRSHALMSGQPLWSFWEIGRDPRGTALTMEFVALANHRKAIRAEILASAERFRTDQLSAICSVFERYEIDQQRYPPLLCTVFMTAISQFLVIEEVMLGMSTGHNETIAFVEEFLTSIEGPRRPQA